MLQLLSVCCCYFLICETTFAIKILEFKNNMGETIWVGSWGGDGKAPVNNGGWTMMPGGQIAVTVADDWSGRFWGRTGCSFDATGKGECNTGGCGRLQCNGEINSSPSTISEFAFNGAEGFDYYQVSLVDGFNIPMSITPIGRTGWGFYCTKAICAGNVNAICPNELKSYVNGQQVGCKSACAVFNTDLYCCRGVFDNPKICRPNNWPRNYPALFKSACPSANSYLYDNTGSTYSCSKASGYTIQFG